MSKVLFCLLLSVALIPAALAMDHRSQYGVGGGLGGNFPAPWSSETFRNQVSAAVPAAGVWARYIPGTPEVGTELSYHYFWLGKQKIHTNAFILSFISRQNPWGSFHPFYSFGVGYSFSDNWFTTGNWEAPVFKLTAGIEFELNDRTDVGFHLNHFSIFKNKPQEQNLHTISPVITLNYYFGTPAPLPAPTIPSPSPVPSTTTAPVMVPTVAPPVEPAKKSPRKKIPTSKAQSPGARKSKR